MTVMQQALFFAVLMQVALTAILYLLLVRSRFSLLKDKSAMRPEMAYDQAAWPMRPRLVSNAVISQFELPVLFYAAALFTLHFNAANWLAAALAWVFVLSRIAHAAIHIGPNTVPVRFLVFLFGFLALIALWANLALHVLGTGS